MGYIFMNNNQVAISKLNGNNSNDEFYTPYDLVQDSLQGYDFTNKIVLLPCDTKESNYYKYFVNNFEELELQKVICVDIDGNRYDYSKHGEKYTKMLDGDYRYSLDVIPHNMVVTNPPFSQIAEFYTRLKIKERNEENYQFIFMGNIMHAKYKKGNLGDDFIHKKLFINKVYSRPLFTTPTGEHKGVGNICIFSNIENDMRESYEFNAPYTGDYDVIDGIINISKFKDVPKNYHGKIAVPLTAVKYKCNVVGLLRQPTINGKKAFDKFIITC